MNQGYYPIEKLKEINREISNLPAYLKQSKHLPRLFGKPMDICGYEFPFCKGFKDFFTNLNDIKDKLIYPNLKVRVLIRNTHEYADLLKEANKPYYMKSIKTFRKLLKVIEYNDHKRHTIPQSEILQLLRGDIPYFYIYTQEKALYDTDGTQIMENFALKTANESLKINLSEYDNTTHINNNIHLFKDVIRQFNGFFINLDDDFSKILDSKLNNKENVRAIALHIFNVLERNIIKHKGNMLIAHVITNDAQNYRYSTMDNDLYDGICGVAFLSLLVYNETKEIKSLNIFNHILKNITNHAQNIFRKKYILDKYSFIYNPTITIYLHLLSVKYLSNEIDYGLIDRYIVWLKHNIEKDKYIDMLQGSASIISFLINNINYFKKAEIEIIVAAFLKRLILGEIIIDKNRISWKFDNNLSNQLVGFSHGSAGILYTLCSIYEFCETKELIKQKIEKTYNYIVSLYNEETQRWYFGIEDHDISYHGYNHGSAGIGIALMKYYYLFQDNQVIYYLNNIIITLIRNLKNDNYTMANGFIGNLMVISEIIKQHRNNISKEALELYDALIDSISFRDIFNGSRNFNGFITHGLYTGFTGVAYGLLYIFSQDDLPNILTFQI